MIPRYNKSGHDNKSKHKATFIIIIIVFIFQKSNENDVQTTYSNVYKVSVCIFTYKIYKYKYIINKLGNLTLNPERDKFLVS